MPQHLQEFFAVTRTAAYRAFTAENGNPAIAKIAGAGRSEVEVGRVLSAGNQLVVAPEGLLFWYCHDAQDRPCRYAGRTGGFFVHTKTSRLVALFESGFQARRCLQHHDRLPLDRRWWSGTERIIAAIGDDHPVFALKPHFAAIAHGVAETQGAA